MFSSPYVAFWFLLDKYWGGESWAFWWKYIQCFRKVWQAFFCHLPTILGTYIFISTLLLFWIEDLNIVGAFIVNIAGTWINKRHWNRRKYSSPLHLPKMVYLHEAARKVPETEAGRALSTVPGTQFMLSALAVAITWQNVRTEEEMRAQSCAGGAAIALPLLRSTALTTPLSAASLGNHIFSRTLNRWKPVGRKKTQESAEPNNIPNCKMRK